MLYTALLCTALHCPALLCSAKYRMPFRARSVLSSSPWLQKAAGLWILLKSVTSWACSFTRAGHLWPPYYCSWRQKPVGQGLTRFSPHWSRWYSEFAFNLKYRSWINRYLKLMGYLTTCFLLLIYSATNSIFNTNRFTVWSVETDIFNTVQESSPSKYIQLIKVFACLVLGTVA